MMQEILRRIIEAAEARNLLFLLIGGNAMILLGYIRNTVDIDLLVESEKRSKWLDLMSELGLHFLHGTGAFAQFEPAKSIGFFKKIGFRLNAEFTDETAACMVVADDINVMLLTHEKFRVFTPK
jgi:hypothetical protein